MSTANFFINGEWKSPLEGGTRDILNPANNQVIATVGDGSVRDVELAIAAARKAFDEGPWPRMRADRTSDAALQAGRCAGSAHRRFRSSGNAK
jgi:acyl-CoA reductase-like NAD-dependent aldehyde dehydrogenase